MEKNKTKNRKVRNIILGIIDVIIVLIVIYFIIGINKNNIRI